MTDLEYAGHLDATAIKLRGLVGDHLKLLAYADEIAKQAAQIRDPKVAAESEEDHQRAALAARGLDPALHQPVPPPQPETADYQNQSAANLQNYDASLNQAQTDFNNAQAAQDQDPA